MEEKKQIKFEVDMMPLAVVLWAIFFWGEPDLVDVLIAYLQKLAGG